MHKAGVLYSSYIANCVLNAFSSYTAIMLNVVTIQAMRKTSSLPKTLKTLLLSLAVSDLGVGLVVQPYYIILLIKRLQQNIESNSAYTMQITFLIIMNLFSCASFFGVLLISLDRFLAIHLHLRYQELVTHKRVVAVVISTWVFSAFFSSVKLWMPVNVTQPMTIFVAIFFGLFFICTTIIYYNIYLTVRRHRNHIRSLQVQRVVRNCEEMAATNVANLSKSAVSTFYVYLVFVLCYLPGYCMMISRMTVSDSNIAMESFDPYSWTLVFVNSSLNPVIYCLKMRHIRHAIIDILRNIFPSHN
ncbi:histamine H2 receptor-like [Oculina patagonica]